MSEKMTQAIEQIESSVATIVIELAYVKGAIAKLRKDAESRVGKFNEGELT